MDKDEFLKIYADGKLVGEFQWKHKKSHRHLFNLAGIEIRNSKTGQLMSKAKIGKEYEADMPDEI